MAAKREASKPLAFFDRGHLDGISYILLQNHTLYQYVVDCVQAVIDTQYGPARTESLEESLQKARCLEQNYRAMGYEIIHIPAGPVEERTLLIIDYIRQCDD